MFSADIQNGLQRAIFTLPKDGVNRKGGKVPLEGQKLEVANSADSSKVAIGDAGTGNPLDIAVQGAEGFEIPEGETAVLVRPEGDGRWEVSARA